MTTQEFEQALHDAEVKLARLKALYEQWFQGIEKLEPSVARKDLDRTLDMLRKSLPRNTALRFRTQQLVARYGTYGIYWSRIARQIEEGTFKRDIVRAARKQQPRKGAREPEPAFELDVDVEMDGLDALEDEKTDPGIVAMPAPVAPKPAPKPAPSPLSFDEGDLDAIFGMLSAEPQKPKSARPLSPFAASAPKPAGGAASATFGKPKEKAPVATAPPVVTPVASSPPRPPATSPVPPVARPVVGAPTIPRPAGPTGPIVSRPPDPVSRPAAAAAPSAPRPAAPVPAPARPAAPVPAPARPAAPAPAPAAAKPGNGNLEEAQMRAIYSRYVDARRANNERTDVRYESLAESVQKMMPKLREKHAGKAIDFEVVLQNGKVGLKPKVGG